MVMQKFRWTNKEYYGDFLYWLMVDDDPARLKIVQKLVKFNKNNIK